MKNIISYLRLRFLVLFILLASAGKSQTSGIAPVYDLVRSHQILLTNEATFKEHTGLNGASAFLVDFRGKTFAVTARHLIGADGGVEPEIKPTDLAKYFDAWTMYPRVPVDRKTDTVRLSKPTMDYSDLDADLLLLSIDITRPNNILPLKPNFELPMMGDTLYIIGCPYSEPDCKQNVYPVAYVTIIKDKALLACTMKDALSMRGFSGAPLVDRNGTVIGVIRGGGETKGTNYVFATFIKEIKTIR